MSNKKNMNNSEQNFSFLDDSPSEKEDASEEEDFYAIDEIQNARREEVLREINQAPQDPREEHEQLNEILGRRERREQKEAKKEQEDKLKKLRQKNALEFFRKIKTLVLLNFKDSMVEAFQAKKYQEKQYAKLLSFFNFDTLTIYQGLNGKQSEKIKRIDFIELIKSLFEESKLEFEERTMKYRVIWSLAYSLGVGLRMLRFIDISNLELEAFYALKYDQRKKSKPTKNNATKKTKKINKSKSKKSLNSEELQSIQLDSISQELLENSLSQIQQQTVQGEKMLICQKTFRDSFCEIYCPVAKNWKLFNMETFQIHDLQMMKKKILNGKAVIGFYSVRILRFLPECEFLQKMRNYGCVQFRDRTINYCDKLENILKRRNRLGCKLLYRDIIKENLIFKTLSIFAKFDRFLIESVNKEQEVYALENFPKNVREMRASEFFVVPSLVDKYMVLKDDAEPIPGLEFREEKVYSKKNLVKVASRMGWIDQYRMVKYGEQPVKITETMKKNKTNLYLFRQTQPFQFKFSEDGDFVLDEEYNSIYVPPTFTPPEGYTMVPYNVEYICKRNKYKCARIVQGFDVAGWHIIPNNIGFLVDEGHRGQIQRMYEERQEKLKQKKESKKEKDAISMWKKLFKSIIITQKV